MDFPRLSLLRTLCLGACLSASVVMIGCDASTTVVDVAASPSAPKTSADFGDAYRIVTERIVTDSTGDRDTLDLSPTLNEPRHTSLDDHPGQLRVTVQYTGGCRDHDFTLETDVGPRRTRLWVLHDAQGDPCRALPTETLTLDVPDAAFAPTRIVLLTPDGGTLTLRP